MELEQKLEETLAAIRSQIEVPDFSPGKMSIWTKFIRLRMQEGRPVEENVGTTHKREVHANTPEELLRHVAYHALLAVYGAEAPIVSETPNLVVRVFDRKTRVQIPGAPALDDPAQIFLRITVNAYDPSLWERLFPSKQEPEE